jgi:hypothetical protein
MNILIVFLLGFAAGYAWRDRVSRIRRAKNRERRRSEIEALKYHAGHVEPGHEKWTSGKNGAALD